MDCCENFILPVHFDPLVRCYRIHAYLINIIKQSYDNFDQYIISNYLSLHNGKEGLRREYLDFHIKNNFINMIDLFYDNGWFDVVQVHDLHKENYFQSKEIIDLIIYFTSKGYYLLQKINEEFLTHSAMYGITSDNTVLIHGVDLKSRSFYILDYKKNGRFCTSKISFNDYLKSTATVIVPNRINFIKAKENLKWEFDYPNAKRLIKCYVDSTNAYPDNESIKNNIFGYEAVERTIKALQTQGMSLIRIRAIKEHKDILLRYFEYITQHEWLDDTSYVDNYNVLCNQMNVAFLKILKKMVLGESNLCFKEDIYTIEKINERERVLLERYLTKYD